jgi:hypothetical protein
MGQAKVAKMSNAIKYLPNRYAKLLGFQSMTKYVSTKEKSQYNPPKSKETNQTIPPRSAPLNTSIIQALQV